MTSNLGLQPHHKAAILGNLWLESNGFKAVREYGKGSGPQHVPPPIGTRGVGYGWVQWTNTRLDDFLNYVKRHNLQPHSDAANLGFFLSELKGPYNFIIQGLRQNGPVTIKHAWYGRNRADTSTIEGATAYVMMTYERPKLGVCHLDRRIVYAKQVLAGMTTNIPQRGVTQPRTFKPVMPRRIDVS